MVTNFPVLDRCRRTLADGEKLNIKFFKCNRVSKRC